MERYVCIHGHFYQPPRENPSLEAVEMQDSAYPYHDWNERITSECYGPNGASRILDGDGRIVQIVNNYAQMSFNFGPTLLAWLQDKAPEVYQSILAADVESQRRFSGHGSALAQAYNHMIMPLANERDKRTQVLWGLRDFQHRFGRFPEGMWLPETAVDLETLDIMAELGIKFTILAQNQASRVRRLSEGSWHRVAGGHIDPSRVYELSLPSGRRMAVFFYDGPISRAVAFEGLLNSGEDLAHRLLGAFSSQSRPQLVHIATDGETYGHHHRRGDMALAYALHYIESNHLARLTNYGEYLEMCPPRREVEVFENSSWSCIHGVERWRSNCGCNSGSHPNWNQEWRGPLREALDWLRDGLASHYERRAHRLLRDPWEARDDYISVILDRSPDNVSQFFKRHATHDLNGVEKTRAIKLLELQRHAMLMYTSCGWFFDELSGIETVQIMQYAARSLQLADEVLGDSLRPGFLERLERAKSNLLEHDNGKQIFEKWVRPSLVDLYQVGAHYAISSLFDGCNGHAKVYSYSVDQEDYRLLSAGRIRLALGRARITSEITSETKRVSFGVLHLGDHNLSGGVREFRGDEAYRALVKTVTDAFERADLPELIRAVDRSFGSNTYSLKLLFRDEQRRILGSILDSAMSDAEAFYRQVYENHAPTMRFVTDLSVPVPKAWHAAAELVINSDLRREFSSQHFDLVRISQLLEEAQRWRVPLDSEGLEYQLRKTLEDMAEALRADPLDMQRLLRLEEAMSIPRLLPFEVNLWKVQNIYYTMMRLNPAGWDEWNRQGFDAAQTWLSAFAALGEKLGMQVARMEENRVTKAPMIATLADDVVYQRHTPNATYRLQFNRELSFRDAQDLVPYLHDLGITDCYASPLLRAGSDSPHGYDICDHSQLNPVLGSEDDFFAFSRELHSRGMGLVLDVVPNHMGIKEASNTWWMDVLENGPSSLYAPYFDINWHPVKPELRNRILLAILEDQYGKVLEKGKLTLTYDDGAFFITYYDHRLPVAPCTYTIILNNQLETLRQVLGEDNEHLVELQSILTALNYLPSRTDLDADKVAERNREKEVIKRRIASLYQANAYVRAAIDTTIRSFNGTVGDPRSFDALDDLLQAQAFRTAFWRVAAEEINYRRFFDINELAAIRVERPDVFRATHQLLLRLLAEGKATGLRIDHPDGLWNPSSYFRNLQESYVQHRIRDALNWEGPMEDLSHAVSSWFADRFDRNGSPARDRWPLYIVAEKILSRGETLPEDWAVDGTTGYDFLNAVNGLFVDSANRKAFDRIYTQFIGSEPSFRSLVSANKKMIMLVSLASEINDLAHRLERIAEKNRLYRDFTLNSLTFAIREIIAALAVYRTYISGPEASQQDQAHIDAAVTEAKRRNPRTASSIFDFIGDSLTLRNLQDFAEEDAETLINFSMRFQQVSGPVMAKGVEDTAFYIYNRLVSLNEVGGQPDRFGVTIADFHRQNAERARLWPHSMLTTSTHDTKRSEDVRARLNVLSEIPEEWKTTLSNWGRINSAKKTLVGGEPAPDRNDEYLLYQALVGTWPDAPMTPDQLIIYRDRIAEYMNKATKEAKVHTSWVNPNEHYDAAVRDFVDRLLLQGEEGPFLGYFLSLQRRVSYYGKLNSLSQVILKLTSPGVPDIYQGTELWDLSLVDPDNRRPVDYGYRRSLLAELKARAGGGENELCSLARELLQNIQDSRIKLFLTHRTLDFRRRHRELFSQGSYIALSASGARREHVCAFARCLDEEAALVVAPRLVVKLTSGIERPPVGPEVWKETWLILPRDHIGRRYRNVLTSEIVPVANRNGAAVITVASALASFPVALLEKMSER